MSNPADLQGELVGVMLKGIIDSLMNVNILSREDADTVVKDIDPSGWYPLKMGFDVFRFLEGTHQEIEAILYRAGKNFVEGWFHGGGSAIVRTAVEFLEFQTGATGYASVVRGERERVGWTQLLQLDLERQVALIESVTLFPREFERGVWMGGMLASGDIDWVDVKIEEEPLPPLYRRRVTIWYRQKPDAVLEKSVEAVVSSSTSLSSAPDELIEALLWKHRGLMVAYERDQRFWQASQHLYDTAIDRLADLSAELTRLANTDSLTGLYNRRKIFELGDTEASLLERLDLPLSVLMVDIDFFKKINDHYGHRTGDEVIKAVAGLLRAGLRRTDHVGRVGGEEFLCLLPNTGESDAYALAESLRKAVEAMNFTTDRSYVDVRVSLGCATATNSVPFEQLVARADVALYASKTSGRNRSKSFSGIGRDWRNHFPSERYIQHLGSEQ